MELNEIYAKIEAGEITLDEINSMDLSHIKEYDSNHIESRVAYWDTYQMALKIGMNSLYGALANEYFPLFNRDIAASITGNGRIFIQGLAIYINKKLQTALQTKYDFVLYGDTDSVYFTLDPLVQKLDVTEKAEILDKLINFDQKYLDKWVQEYIDDYAEQFNAFNKKPIGAKLEKIADKGIFVAKKKYALRAVWDEGSFLLENPKTAVTGLEIVRSSTPGFCRKYLKQAIPIILDNGEKDVADFIASIKDEFMTAPVDYISRVSGIGSLAYDGDIGKYQKPGKGGKMLTAPMNVRAAKNYNIFIKQQGLDGQFPEITDKDKIKYAFLKMPNKLGDDVIAFHDDRFLDAADLTRFVDREYMFDLVFLQPLQIMLDAVGYNVNKNFEFDLDMW